MTYLNKATFKNIYYGAGVMAQWFKSIGSSSRGPRVLKDKQEFTGQVCNKDLSRQVNTWKLKACTYTTQAPLCSWRVYWRVFRVRLESLYFIQ